MNNQPPSQPQEVETLPTSDNGNGSQPPSDATGIPLRECKRSSKLKSAKVERLDQPAIHRSTGPRTPQGKKRSKLNALKHGLLSKVILLEGESRVAYVSLLNGLWDDFQPQGKLEAVLVENLAALFWRKCRLFQAEKAEVSRNIAFVDVDAIKKQ